MPPAIPILTAAAAGGLASAFTVTAAGIAFTSIGATALGAGIPGAAGCCLADDGGLW